MINHFKRSGSILTTLLLTLILVMLSRYIPYEPGNVICVNLLSHNIINVLAPTVVFKSVVIILLANLLGFFSYLINDKFIILNKRTYFPYFFAATLVVAGPYMQNLCSAHLGFILVFLSLYIVLLNEEAKNKNLNIMNASLILALSSFFQFQTLFFAPVLWFAVSLQKNFSFKALQASIIGMLVPYAVVLGFLYVFASVDPILDSFRHLSFFSHWQVKNVPEGFWLLFAGVSLMVFAGFISFLRFRETLNTISRRSMETFSVFMVFNLLFFALGIWSLQSSLVYGSLPASIIISGLWIRTGKRWRRIMLYAYIILLILSFIVKF